MELPNLILLHEAVTKFKETTKNIGGCDDGDCLIVKPKFDEFLSPKGNCRCHTDQLKMKRFTHAVDRLMERLTKVTNECPIPLKSLKGITKIQPKRLISQGKYE